jgi:hypothetical protein
MPLIVRRNLRDSALSLNRQLERSEASLEAAVAERRPSFMRTVERLQRLPSRDLDGEKFLELREAPDRWCTFRQLKLAPFFGAA